MMNQRKDKDSSAPRGSPKPIQGVRFADVLPKSVDLRAPTAINPRRTSKTSMAAHSEEVHDLKDSSTDLPDGLDTSLDEALQSMPEDAEELKKALLAARAEIQRLRRGASGSSLEYGALNLAAIQVHDADTAKLTDALRRTSGNSLPVIGNSGLKPIQGGETDDSSSEAAAPPECLTAPRLGSWG